MTAGIQIQLYVEITLRLRNMKHGADRIIVHQYGSSCTTSISCIHHRTELYFIQKLLHTRQYFAIETVNFNKKRI
jgi:D-hexose-6-phosphate mutarotase